MDSSDYLWSNGEGRFVRGFQFKMRMLMHLSCIFVCSLLSSFLAGWPGLAFNESHETWLRRIAFGVNFLVKLPPQVAIEMTASIIQYSLTTTQLLQSVTPFFGEPDSYVYNRNMDRLGDVAAKTEARKMISASDVVPKVPVAFEDDSSKEAPEVVKTEVSSKVSAN